MAKAKKISNVEADLLEGLGNFAQHLSSGKSIHDGYTVRRVVLKLQPTTYRPADVKRTRALLNASQPLFAQFLGVSDKTVRAWESGKLPSGIAARFMDEIQTDPTYWRERVRKAAKLKKPTATSSST